MPAELKSTSRGGTMVLTISNPESAQRARARDLRRRRRGAERRRQQPEVRSVVITGEGGMFCAGGNLQRLQANRQQPPEVQAQSIEGLHDWIETIRSFPKPVIAAVEGAAAGAGFSLALACDFIVAAADAVFVMAYSSVALSPDGGAHLAPGARAAAPAGQRAADGRRAHRRRAPACAGRGQPRHRRTARALAEALALAERLNARAPNALASIKELLNEAAGASLHAQLARERDHFVRNLHHRERRHRHRRLPGQGQAALLMRPGRARR